MKPAFDKIKSLYELVEISTEKFPDRIALSEYKKEWSWEEMNGFLIKPSAWIKGNKMGFAGLKKEKDRASVILYLNQKSDNPKDLP